MIKATNMIQKAIPNAAAAPVAASNTAPVAAESMAPPKEIDPQIMAATRQMHSAEDLQLRQQSQTRSSSEARARSGISEGGQMRSGMGAQKRGRPYGPAEARLGPNASFEKQLEAFMFDFAQKQQDKITQKMNQMKAAG